MYRLSSAAALAAALTLCPSTFAEEAGAARLDPLELVGTYQVRAKLPDGRRTSGKLVIKPRLDGGLDLAGEVAGLGSISTSADEAATRFDLDAPREPDRAPAKGAAGRLGDELINPWAEEEAAEAERTHRFLTLVRIAKDRGRYYQGTVRKGGQVAAHLKLQRRNRVLVANVIGHSSAEKNTFGGYGKLVAKHYEALRRWDTQRIEVSSWQEIFTALLAAWAEGHRFNRLVTISHGGWDGPILSSQISSRSGWSSSKWSELVETLKKGLAPNAKYFVSGCHAGGSNRWELEDYGDYRWSVAVAKATGRFVAGPAGTTSTGFALIHVKAVLEGQGKVKQEIWAGGPDGVRRIGTGGTIGYSKPTPWPTEEESTK